MSKTKKETFTVMHELGEKVDGTNVRPYETFQSVMTPELEEKVKKGYLVKGVLKSSSSGSSKKSKARHK